MSAPAAPRPKRWKRWLRRAALALLAVVVLLLAFHRPLLRWTARFAAQRFAASQGLTFAGSLGGSVTGDLELHDVKLAGPGGGLVREISVGTLEADYDLWELRKRGAGAVVKSLTLRDAVIDLDLTKTAADQPQKDTAKNPSPLPQLDVPRVDIRNATLRLRDASGVVEVSGLTLQLTRGETGTFALEHLALPSARIDWHQIAGKTSVAGEAITLTDVTWDTPLVLRRLTADLARLDAGRLPLVLEIERRESRISARGELSLGSRAAFDGTARLVAITPESLAEFVALPADQVWRAESLDLEWHGPFDSPAAVSGRLSLDAGPVAVAGYVTDSGRLEATLLPKNWQVNSLVLRRSGGEVKATGTLEPPAAWDDWSRLGLSAQADLAMPKVQDVFSHDPPVAGGATGRASISLVDGRISTLAAQVAAAPVTAGGKTLERVEIEAAGNLETLRIDRAFARLTPRNEATVTGTASLTGAMPFDVAWTAAAGDLPALAAWIGLGDRPLPTAGMLRASGTAAARVEDLKSQAFGTARATVEATSENVVWNGGTLQRASVTGALENGHASVTTLSVVADEANRLLASGAWDLGPPHAFDGAASVELTRLASLSGWSELFHGPRLEGGSVALTWKGGGTLDDRAITGEAQLTARGVKTSATPQPVSAELVASHEGQTLRVPKLHVTAGPVVLDGELSATPDLVEVPKLLATREGRTLVSARASVPLTAGERVPLDPARPLDVALRTDRVDVGEFFALAGQSAPVRGVLTASLDVAGQWPNPTLQLTATAVDVAAAATEGKLQPARATLEASYQNNRLAAQLEAVQQPLRPLTAKVSVPLSLEKLSEDPQTALNAPLDATLMLPASDLAPLTTFVPAIKEAKGTVAADVTAHGTVKSPKINGTVRVNAPVLAFADAKLPELREIRVAIDADDKRARLTELKAGIAGGTLSAGGTFDWSTPEGPALDFSLRANEALLMRDDLASVRADAEMTCRGKLSEAAVSGRVALVRGRVYKEIEFLPLSLPGQLPPPPPPVTRAKVEAKTPGFFDKWMLDVAVTTRDEVRLLGNVLNGGVVADLRVGGTGAQPWLEGKATAENARVRLPFSRLKINRGTVSFTRENPFEPTLDLQGDSFVNGYLVNVVATGSALDPKLHLSSSPPLPEGEIATLLATGATTGDLRGSQGEAANRAAFLLISQTYRKLFKKAGVPERIDDEPPRLSFSFSVLESGTSQRGVKATYELSDHWQAVGGVGQRGTFRGLLYYLIRFR